MSKLLVRMRPDLVLEAHGRGGERHWVVQDPVSLQYFRLRDEECAILRMLDGRLGLEEICERFERMFAPLRLGARQLQAFVYRLHELGLVVADSPGQGEVLRKRMTSTRWRNWLAALANPLAIRLPGMPAAPFVDWLYARVRWMFGPAFLALCCLLVVTALGLVACQLTAFQARLPDFWSFFNVRSAGWFALALVGVKILHELGHALACRHFGGQCREIGVMLLCGTPAMYCDVSDAWRIESRWRRVVISSAGMLVELVLASIATLLWWCSEPGLCNSMCLRVMFLCSVSTLVFNLNPLLRCDGYYILSDLVGVPNLWQESRSLVQRQAGRWLFGMDLPDDPTIPPRIHSRMMLYAVASMVYCTLLVCGILWFCLQVAEPHGLAPLALALAALVLAGMAIPPAYRLSQRLSQPHRWSKIRRGRTSITVVAALAIVAAIIFVPLPHRIAAPVWLEAEGAQPVYVTVAGTVREAAPAGTRVVKGQTVVRLASPEIDARIAELSAELAREEKRLANLKILLSDDPSIAPLVPAAEKTAQDVRERLAQWKRDADRLALAAPKSGTVISPIAVPHQSADQTRLVRHDGTPLDRRNRGCYLETGELVCLVGDPQRLEAMLVIDQAAVPFVRVGQTVRIRIDQGPASVLTGKITEIARTDADDLPTSLVRALDLPLAESAGGPRPAQQIYEARVELAKSSAPLLVGMHGQAKILADWQPLGQRLLRYLQRTFRIA